MKIVSAIAIATICFEFSHGYFTHDNLEAIVNLVNSARQKRLGIKNSFHSYDKRVYAVRQKAVRLFEIEDKREKSKVDKFIVIDEVSFEGGKSMYGEMVLNDTCKFFYKTPFLSKTVEKYAYPVDGESTILEYLKAHRFKELEALANERGKRLSGSHFVYIGMYERGMDSVYVQLLPAFVN